MPSTDRGIAARDGAAAPPTLARRAAAPPRSSGRAPGRDRGLGRATPLDARNTGVAKAAYWKDRRFFLVAERGDAMLGFIVGEVRAWELASPPSGWIFAVHVAPDARLHGLGTLLFEEICQRFRKAGVVVQLLEELGASGGGEDEPGAPTDEGRALRRVLHEIDDIARA